MKMMKNGNKKGIMFSRQTMRYGSYALLISIIAMSLLVALNAILGMERVRTALRVDITKNKLFSVGDQTTTVLKDLKKNVEFIILLDEVDFSSTMLKEIFKQYELKSGGKVTTRFVDLDKDPQFVKRELDPTGITGIAKGDLVVKSGTKVRLITQNELQDTQIDRQTGQTYSNGLIIEQAFTGAIQNVTSDVTPKVYFLTGHGELTPDADLSTLKGTLDINNYKVESLTLAKGIPDDAAVLVLANPSIDLLGEETAILSDWLRNKGGDLIVFADANPKAAAMPNLQNILETFNLKLNNDVVMEGNQQNYLDKANFVIPRVAANEITTKLDPNSVMLLLPNARTVEILNNTKEWLTSFPIFQTSDQASRLDVSSGYQTPVPGTFLMGAATVSKGGAKESRMVVLGNSAFVSNNGMSQTNDNGKRYILTMINWMQDKTDQIIIPAKNNAAPVLTMTAQSTFIVFLLLVAVLPLIIIGTGVFVWMRRRHL